MSFYFEIYTSTGIEVGRCDAESKAQAKEKIKNKFKNFEEFIQFYEVSKDYCTGWLI